MTTGLELTSFDDFLKLARRQTEPQQLLFVFTRSELPADHTPEQAARFAAGQGGHLAPVVCVDRGLHEIPGFQAFASEADAHIDDWAVIFAAALPGIGNRPPTPLAIDAGARPHGRDRPQRPGRELPGVRSRGDTAAAGDEPLSRWWGRHEGLEHPAQAMKRRLSNSLCRLRRPSAIRKTRTIRSVSNTR